MSRVDELIDEERQDIAEREREASLLPEVMKSQDHLRIENFLKNSDDRLRRCTLRYQEILKMSREEQLKYIYATRG